MDAEQPSLIIVFAASARIELDEIWAWNKEKYNAKHAVDYLDFLLEGIGQLATKHGEGKLVDGFPQLKALTLKRSPRGHGHVIIYRVEEAVQRIRILHVYHTRQDIRGRLEMEGNR